MNIKYLQSLRLIAVKLDLKEITRTITSNKSEGVRGGWAIRIIEELLKKSIEK